MAGLLFTNSRQLQLLFRSILNIRNVSLSLTFVFAIIISWLRANILFNPWSKASPQYKTIERRNITFHLQLFQAQRPNNIIVVRLFSSYIFWSPLNIPRPFVHWSNQCMFSILLFRTCSQVVSFCLCWNDKSLNFHCSFWRNVKLFLDFFQCFVVTFHFSCFNWLFEYFPCFFVKYWLASIERNFWFFFFFFFWLSFFDVVFFWIITSRYLERFHEYVFHRSRDCFINSLITGVVSTSTRRSFDHWSVFNVNKFVIHKHVSHKLSCSWSCWRYFTAPRDFAWINETNSVFIKQRSECLWNLIVWKIWISLLFICSTFWHSFFDFFSDVRNFLINSAIHF